MTDPAPVRRPEVGGRLDEGALARTWLDQLRLWVQDAAADPAIVEPNAMQVATVGAGARPSVRTVLLKGLDERGIVFYTNYDSAKAHDLAVHPYAAAVIVWAGHQRQVRLDGPVSRVDPAETRAYFATRPRGAQLGAWASPQSSVIASRAELDTAVREVAQRFAGTEIPVPPHWGGYRIVPRTVEFWQGRPDRLHDRLRWRLDGERWAIERLAP